MNSNKIKYGWNKENTRSDEETEKEMIEIEKKSNYELSSSILLGCNGEGADYNEPRKWEIFFLDSK